MTIISFDFSHALSATKQTAQKVAEDIIHISKKEIRLELGERLEIRKLLKDSPRNIWIEHKNILQIDSDTKGTYFSAKNVGLTQIRFNSNFFNVYVMPPNTRSGYKTWKSADFRSNHIQIEYCGIFLCVKNEVKSLSEYLEMLAVISKNEIPVYFTYSPNQGEQIKIERFVQNELRNEGLVPHKLIFARTWRMYYNSKSENQFLRKKLNSLGIEYYSSRDITDLAENIEVQVRIVEAGKNFARKWGLNWPSQIQAASDIKTGVFELNKIEAALNFAESEGEAKIIASPRLVTRNEKPAEFFAGGELPVRISNHRQNRIEWRKFGISLKIKPKLDSLGQISLEIETEVSSVNHAFKIDDIPAIQLSRTLSHFDLPESKTISLSGLIRNESSISSEGIAFLKNIPVIGELFKSRSFLENKSELIIFVTPRLASAEVSSL